MAEEELSKKEQKKKEKEEKKAAKKAAKEAKKNGEPMPEGEEEESGGTLLIVIVGLLIIIVWLAIFALLIKMDVGGVGSTILYPILKDVPYVNMILPETEEYAEVDAAYQFDSMEDAVARIKELEAQLAEAKATDETDASYVAELEAQAQELATYKANEAAFEEIKEKFYEEVVFGDNSPDIEEYKEYYESIEPENAEVIYKQVIGQIQEDEEITEYANTYANMKPAQAAAIFNTMTDNLALVGKILWAMDTDARAKILGAMDSDTAASVTKLMEP
ncbi:MAG: hypothetical protein K5675_09220 [Lachnospiraceae bacterium]|nr:hypothetical protein [Lachnospiraceae bacterium]